PPSPHTINRSIFLNYPSPTGIYPLSLHDALPIWMVIAPLLLGTRTLGWMKLSSRGIPPCKDAQWWRIELIEAIARQAALALHHRDRKSTRLNSSHLGISYAVFCLKKKKHKFIHRM